MRFIKPDFNNNIVNISATLAEFLGCPNDKPILPKLKEELQKNYKNVVFIIFDGMGMNPINLNLSEKTFIRRNIKNVLTSVFPSTTTNATTTLLTNKYPMEHGWFGWSLHFEELERAVDLYLSTDSYTQETISPDFLQKRLPIKPYYSNANTEYQISKVVPNYWHDGNDQNRYVCEEIDDFFSNIKRICKQEGKQFIYTYCPEPDSTMHNFGVSSTETKSIINELNDKLELIYSECEDTLFIITADHGQIDIDGHIDLYQDKEIISMLEWPQFLEARATAFKVKPEYKQKFEVLFAKKYGNDFDLLHTKDLIANDYFGDAIHNDNAKLLGDYISIGKTNKVMKLTEHYPDFMGHHTSLTLEMEVPLIYYGTNIRDKV